MSAKFFSTVSAVTSTPFCLEKLLTRTILAFALGTVAHVPAHAIEAAVSEHNSVTQSAPATSTNQPLLTDGVYLYGQAPKPNHLGAAYMVVKVSKQQVVGAFYMPSSSFDCFQGKVQGEKLALTVVDSYENTSHPYSLALYTNTAVAASNQVPVSPIVPEGYHLIETVSDNDRRLLSTCQANYSSALLTNQ